MLLKTLEALDNTSADHFQVALLKSRMSGNRGYCYVDPNVHNDGDDVPDLPGKRIVGIGYPCLEDGMNDLSIIDSTMETISYFSAQDMEEIGGEFTTMINEHREQCIKRILQLRERTAELSLTLLGGDLREFKSHAIILTRDGLDIEDARLMYRHSLTENSEVRRIKVFSNLSASDLESASPREASLLIYSHMIDSLRNDLMFQDLETFRNRIFFQYLALMNLQWRTTPKIFHGTAPEDYGVSATNSKHGTAMYKQIGEELTHFGAWRQSLYHQASALGSDIVLDDILEYVPMRRPDILPTDSPRVKNERILMPTILAIVGNANLLMYQDQQFAETVELHMKNILRQLQAYGILSGVVQIPDFSGNTVESINPSKEGLSPHLPSTLFRFLYSEIVDRIGQGVDGRNVLIYERLLKESTDLITIMKEQGFFRPGDSIATGFAAA